MIVNVNARITGNNSVYVQYQEDGKSKDAGFSSWETFIEWLAERIKQ